MATPAVELDRPLRVGELLATTVRTFGTRPWPFLVIGVLEAVVFVAASTMPIAAGIALLSVAFAAAFAAVTRIVLGDALAPAWLRTARAAPVLLALAFVVAVPFYLGFALGLILIVFSAAWLGLTAFAVPAAMAEDGQQSGFAGWTTHALRRTRELASVNYVHALAVSAALILVYVLVSVVLSVALSEYADNSRLAAQALAQILLAPFFFIGLTVLYLDQRARLLEAKGAPGRRS